MSQKQSAEVHSGHRQRMLDTYLSAGADAFSDVQLLEFLLGYSIARKNTNEIAHRLLAEYGDLTQIMETPVEQLVKTVGIGARTAALLHFVGDYYLRAQRSHHENGKSFTTTAMLGTYLTTWFGPLREEHAVIMCLDASCRMLACREISVGTVNSVNLPYRKVVEIALNANATSVVLAHNHTNDSTMPSHEDIAYTVSLKEALELFNIALADHFVISGNLYFSMRNAKLF